MDRDRFDRLAVSLGRGISRRRLGTAAGGGLAVALASLARGGRSASLPATPCATPAATPISRAGATPGAVAACASPVASPVDVEGCPTCGGKTCADFSNDPANCGKCGNSCEAKAPGGVCINAACCEAIIGGASSCAAIPCCYGRTCQSGRCCNPRGLVCANDDQCCSGTCDTDSELCK